MITQYVTGLPSEHIETVWQWLCAMPRKAKRDVKDKVEFTAAFEGDPAILVFDDGILGFVTLENKKPGIFEAHLFCPRRILTKRLTQAIASFFQHVRRLDQVQTLLFDVRALQPRLGSILIDEGCRFTGWSYYENGELFRTLIWEK